MAFRPSLRRHHKEVSTELNLNPMLDMMTVLIPLLLANAQFAKVGELELNLPSAASGVAQGAAALPKETQRTLDLVVSITDRGLYISSAISAPEASPNRHPAIPILADGGYDFQVLSQLLYEIKQKAGNNFADPEAVVIQAEPKVRYQVLVSAMDAARRIRIGENIVSLFPNVSLSAGVL